MNRQRTKEEITASGYYRQSELKRIYGNTNGSKIFKAAYLLDTEELGKDRVITNMVRIASVHRVIGIKKGGLTVARKTADGLRKPFSL